MNHLPHSQQFFKVQLVPRVLVSEGQSRSPPLAMTSSQRCTVGQSKTSRAFCLAWRLSEWFHFKHSFSGAFWRRCNSVSFPSTLSWETLWLLFPSFPPRAASCNSTCRAKQAQPPTPVLDGQLPDWRPHGMLMAGPHVHVHASVSLLIYNAAAAKAESGGLSLLPQEDIRDVPPQILSDSCPFTSSSCYAAAPRGSVAVVFWCLVHRSCSGLWEDTRGLAPSFPVLLLLKNQS